MTTPLLEGIRVLDFASVGPAARASRWLADYGAEVVKVGPVPRQGGVQITPPFYAYSGHRDMKRALFDLKADGGREAFLRLAATAQVVIESFRPGVVDRLGVGFEAVRAENPAVVYCSTSGYGQTGPWAQHAGHDLNYLAMGGFLDCTTRRADGGPPIPGATVADSAGGGMHATMSILAALVSARETGVGTHLDVSVAEGVLAFMSLNVDEYLATGERPRPGHNILTGRYACYDLYECRDGGWLSVAAIEPAFWANLCRALGLDRWIDHQTDEATQDEIREDLRNVLATKDRDEWVDELAANDTCVAPVLSVPELVEHEQFAARAAIVDAEAPDGTTFRQVGRVLAGQHDAASPNHAKDMAVTDTDELLEAAGLTSSEIELLREQGAVA